MKTQEIKAPVWFITVAITLIFWNLMGIFSFVHYTTISEASIQALPEAERQLYDRLPLWTLIAYGIAVFGGTLGSVALLMKKKWAKPVFIISLLALLVQMYYSIFIAHTMDVYGPSSLIMPTTVIIVAFFEIWLASYGTGRAWLN